MVQGGQPPDPWQAHLLRSAAARTLLLCSRQSGKSTVAASLALRAALLEAPALVLLLSPGLRQSGEIFRKVKDLYAALGRPVAARAETALTLELVNGSRIVALPGNEATVRCYSGVALLIVDEASRVDDGLYFSIRPMLAVSHGRLLRCPPRSASAAFSTPLGIAARHGNASASLPISVHGLRRSSWPKSASVR